MNSIRDTGIPWAEQKKEVEYTIIHNKTALQSSMTNSEETVDHLLQLLFLRLRRLLCGGDEVEEQITGHVHSYLFVDSI